VERLGPACRLVEQAAFGTERFIGLIREGGKWDLLCNHGAEVGNYKSAEFDVNRALLSDTLHLRKVLEALKGAGCRGVVLTGTVFENDEGEGSEPLGAFSPYGLAKGLTWQVFRFYAPRAGLALGKFVIPNPFGPLEEGDRFTAYLMKTWRAGGRARVKTPEYVRDNIPVELLARAYRVFAEAVAASEVPLRRVNPSGYVEKQGAFTLRVAREVRERVGWACGVEMARQEDFSEPLTRVNNEPAVRLVKDWVEAAGWDGFVEYYAREGAG
jgi:nucleoside-diphosphate-sugar epimerase